MTKHSLGGLRVLVTRPQQQAAHLMRLVTAAGGIPIGFPVIEVVPVAKEQWQQQTLDGVDWLMFVSPNAVTQFCQQWSRTLPAGMKLAAVGGDTTAQAMLSAGLSVDCIPPISTGSDGLLTLSELQEMQGQTVVIVRGNGGRDVLARGLAERGANIRYMEVYRREIPAYDKQQKQAALQADIVSCTSLAGLNNLLQLLADYRMELQMKPLVVFSERIRRYALELGFKQVMATSAFTDEAMVASLIEMDKQHGKRRTESAD